MFVVYEADDEVLVTTKKREGKMKEEWFNFSSMRNLDDYDRNEVDEVAVQVKARLTTR